MNITPEEIYHLTKILMVSSYCIIFIVGIIGNGLVIWISGFRTKTVSAVWFLNLAIADFIFCLSLPYRVINWLTTSQYFFDEYIPYLIVVHFNFSMLAINSVVSVTFLTVINIHRCVSIIWPLWAKVHITRRSARIASVCLWIVPLSGALLLNFFTDLSHGSAVTKSFYLVTPPLTFFLKNDSYYASNYSSEDNISFYHYITFSSAISSVFTFWIPFAIILVCNGLIISKLRSSPLRKPKAFHRTFRMIAAVVVCFFVCWFPFNMWPLIENELSMWVSFADFLISNLCLCLISISSCMNPILYVLLGHRRGTNTRKSIKARIENTINDFK